MPGWWKAEAKTQLPVLWRRPPPGSGHSARRSARAGAVGVAGDHVGAVDSEPARQLGRGVDAAAEDRRGGEVGVEVGAQQAVERPDAGREAGADGGA